MLKVYIPPTEYYDERSNLFTTVDGITLSLEHSLVSISKWESKWKKEFLSKDPLTVEQTTDYIRCMTITPNVNPLVYRAIPPSVIKQVNDYIADDMSATTFYDTKENKPQPKKQKRITSEYLYYVMFSLGIPKECEKWHLNRLLALIKIYQVENNKTKMSKKDLYSQNRSLNAARRAALHSKG